MKLLDRKALREKGIGWSRQHLDRKVKAREFPAPVKLGPGTNAWLESEIDDWIAERAAARDSKPQDQQAST